MPKNNQEDPSLEAHCKHGAAVNAVQNAMMTLDVPQTMNFHTAEQFIVNLRTEGYILREV